MNERRTIGHLAFALDVGPGVDPRRPQHQRDEPGRGDHDAGAPRRPPRPVRQRPRHRKVPANRRRVNKHTNVNKTRYNSVPHADDKMAVPKSLGHRSSICRRLPDGHRRSFKASRRKKKQNNIAPSLPPKKKRRSSSSTSTTKKKQKSDGENEVTIDRLFTEFLLNFFGCCRFFLKIYFTTFIADANSF